LNYLWNVLHGDFGLSTGWVGNTVAELIQGGFAYSARIGFTAAILAVLLGIVLYFILRERERRTHDAEYVSLFDDEAEVKYGTTY
jgi:oligopeptide transport system permease protein